MVGVVVVILIVVKAVEAVIEAAVVVYCLFHLNDQACDTVLWFLFKNGPTSFHFIYRLSERSQFSWQFLGSSNISLT